MNLLRKAQAEAAETRTWVCATCERMIDDRQEGPYCRSCGQYWQDVQNGLFDFEPSNPTQ